MSFPFPIHFANLENCFGPAAAQKLEQDLAVRYNRRKCCHLLNHVLDKQNQVTEKTMKQWKEIARNVRRSLIKKVSLLASAAEFLEKVEQQYREHMFARTSSHITFVNADTAIAVQSHSANPYARQVFMCRNDGDQYPTYLVVERNYCTNYMTHITDRMNYDLLFSDGVILPYAREAGWPLEERFTSVTPIGVMTVQNGEILFDTQAAEQEFKQSLTVDDYFIAIGVKTDLEKIKHFFETRTLFMNEKRFYANFANKTTIDKFMALFPDVVAAVKKFSHNHRQGDLMACAAFCKKRSAYSQFALWYLFFQDLDVYRTYRHEDVLILMTQTYHLRETVEKESYRWMRIVDLLDMAYHGLTRQQELDDLGLLVNESIVYNAKGEPYLFTDFDFMWFSGNMRFTRILKNNKLSKTKQTTVELADFKNGKSFFTLSRPTVTA